MPYTPHTWVNGAAPFLNAVNLNQVETGISNATTVAENAIPKWKPTTAYAAGALVLNPSGRVVSAIAAFTSGGTYNAANWTEVITLAYLGGAPIASPTFTGTVITPALRVSGGTPAVGKVLTSDATGNATWATGGTGSTDDGTFAVAGSTGIEDGSF